jgi:hypothetical protein
MVVYQQVEVPSWKPKGCKWLVMWVRLFQELLDSFIPLQGKESLDKSLDDQESSKDSCHRKSATAAMEQRYQCLDWMHKQKSGALTWNSKELHWCCASAGVQVWCSAACRLCPCARVSLSDCPSGRGESGGEDEAIWGCLVLKLEAGISVSQSRTMEGRWSLMGMLNLKLEASISVSQSPHHEGDRQWSLLLNAHLDDWSRIDCQLAKSLIKPVHWLQLRQRLNLKLFQ